MIELARHIEILLLDNDCVIVPGLGGFMTHHVDSCYNEEEQLFYPPSRTLGFNPQLQVNDSLLAQSYVEAYDISYPEAILQINNEVCEIRKELSNEGFYELNNIGVIRANEEGNYIFEPCSAGVLTPSLYALTSFSMPSLVKGMFKNVIENNLQISNQSDGVNYPLAEASSSVMQSDEKDSNTEKESELHVCDVEDEFSEEYDDEISGNKVITISFNTLRNTAVAIGLVLVAVITTLHLGIKNYESQQAGLDTGLLQKIMPQMKTTPVRGINKNINKSTKNGQKENQLSSNDIQSADSHNKVISSKDVWVVVLASHVSGKNAELYMDQLKGDGIASVRMIRKGHKIVCGSFDNEVDAHSYIKVVKNKSTHCEDCWITKITE